MFYDDQKRSKVISNVYFCHFCTKNVYFKSNYHIREQCANDSI